MSKRIYLSPPHVSQRERELLLRAFDSNWIAPTGPMVDAFESAIKQYTGMPGAAALSSGTAGLHLALKEVGVQEGDRVFVSTFTFAATANAVCYCGAVPVWIDSGPGDWNMDPEMLDKALKEAASKNQLPKAIVTVDLYGQCADYDNLLPLAAEYGIPVIEDAAEAMGARYKGKPAGAFGDAAVFSFNGNKIITTSGGGMVVSRNTELIRRIKYLSTQARQPERHYEHTEIGYNYRLSNLLAAVGIGQIEGLEEKIRLRKRNWDYYVSLFGSHNGIHFMPVPEWSEPNYWLTCVEIDSDKTGISREQIRHALEEENIESRYLWKPMHQQPVFKKYASYLNGVSDGLFDKGLCLPSGSSLEDSDLERIGRVLCSIIK